MSCELRLEWPGVSCLKIWGKSFQAEGTAMAKAALRLATLCLVSKEKVGEP